MQKQTPSLDQAINRELKNFLRGLTQRDLSDRYESYKALFKLGPAAIPQIRELLFKSDWSEVKYPNEIRYVTGLVSLIHDLDEFESEQIRAKLLSNGCDPALGRILDSIGSFKSQDYIQYEVRGIKIFEHHQLLTKENVKRILERWLKSVPDEDLEAIQHQCFGLRQHGADLDVHQRADDDGPRAVACARLIDLLDRLLGFLRRIDEGQGGLAERHLVELREQAMAQHLRGDAGAVGNEKCATFVAHFETRC